MLIGLKIDCFSLRAALDTVPALLRLLDDYQLKATFFCALGPDPRAAHGLLPRLRQAGSIGEEAGGVLARIPEQGHELGAVPYDLDQWRRHVLERDAAWSLEQLQAGVRAFAALFGGRARAVAAPDFLINADVPRLEEQLGFDYAVDTRGLTPYLPMTQAGPSRCPQLPVTLPRIEEVLARGVSLDDAHQFLFMECQKPVLPGHLFNFTAGNSAYLPILEKLLVMWMGSQRKPGPVRALLEQVDRDDLRLHYAGLLQGPGGRILFGVQGEPASDR